MRKAHNRFQRLMAGFFLPAVIFAFITVLIISFGISVTPLSPAFGSISGLISLILASWVLGSIQCIIYSVLMEYVINPHLKTDALVIFISAVLIPIAVWSVPGGFPLALLIIASISGYLTGYLLRDMYKYYA